MKVPWQHETVDKKLVTYKISLILFKRYFWNVFTKSCLPLQLQFIFRVAWDWEGITTLGTQNSESRMLAHYAEQTSNIYICTFAAHAALLRYCVKCCRALVETILALSEMGNLFQFEFFYRLLTNCFPLVLNESFVDFEIMFPCQEERYSTWNLTISS